MSVNLDSLFLIGDSHTVCQDYTLTGNSEGLDYLIVSDGCSSSKNSDLGSRLLALVAKQFICSRLTDLRFNASQRYVDFGMMVITKARVLAAELKLEDSCLDATLLVTVKDANNIFTYVYGDGSIIRQDKNGDLCVVTVSFESGAPFYLNYWLDQGRLLGYKDQFSGSLTIESPSIPYRAIESYDYPISMVNDASDTSMFAISTDGIDSFTNKTYGTVINPTSDLFSFKNTNGEFLKRRVEREVASLRKSTIVHQDDLGIAAMVIKDESC